MFLSKLNIILIKKRKLEDTMVRFHVQYQIKSIVVIWNLVAQPTEVEIILYVIIIHLTEILIAP